MSILSQDDRSETVAALVLGARRRRVKSRAFLRQENPSETVAALVQEGGSVLVDGKLGSGWALWPRPCCSPSLSHKSVAVLWFSSWVLKCCGFPQECCSVFWFWVLQCSASAPCLVMLCHNVVVCCSFVLSQLCVARVFCSSVLKY